MTGNTDSISEGKEHFFAVCHDCGTVKDESFDHKPCSCGGVYHVDTALCSQWVRESNDFLLGKTKKISKELSTANLRCAECNRFHQSCPPLISKPYLSDTLNKQLDENAASFINTTEHNYLRGNTLYVSKIFKWFAEDFNNDPMAFIQKYADTDLRNQLDTRKKKIKLEYLDYDWSLNNTRSH